MDNHKIERIKTILIFILIGVVIGFIGQTIYRKNEKSNSVKIESENKKVQFLWNDKFKLNENSIKVIKVKIEDKEYYIFINSTNQYFIVLKDEK